MQYSSTFTSQKIGKQEDAKRHNAYVQSPLCHINLCGKTQVPKNSSSIPLLQRFYLYIIKVPKISTLQSYIYL